MPTNTLKPHYRKGNKFYFRYNKQRMVLEKKAPNHYEASGDIIEDKNIQLITDETINYATVKIDVKQQHSPRH